MNRKSSCYAEQLLLICLNTAKTDPALLCRWLVKPNHDHAGFYCQFEGGNFSPEENILFNLPLSEENKVMDENMDGYTERVSPASVEIPTNLTTYLGL